MTKDKLLELAVSLTNSILSNPINSSMCRINKSKDRIDLIKSEVQVLTQVAKDMGIEIEDK